MTLLIEIRFFRVRLKITVTERLVLKYLFFRAEFICAFYTWIFSPADFTIDLVFTYSFRAKFTIARSRIHVIDIQSSKRSIQIEFLYEQMMGPQTKSV
jgi:hypothetical protein